MGIDKPISVPTKEVWDVALALIAGGHEKNLNNAMVHAAADLARVRRGLTMPSMDYRPESATLKNTDAHITSGVVEVRLRQKG